MKKKISAAKMADLMIESSYSYIKEKIKTVNAANNNTNGGYSHRFIMDALRSFHSGSAMLGQAANKLMVISAIGAEHPSVVKRLFKKYSISMEAIVDASVQGDNIDEARRSIDNIDHILDDLIDMGLPISRILAKRIAEYAKKKRKEINISGDDAISYIWDVWARLIELNYHNVNGRYSSTGELESPGIIHNIVVDAQPFAAYCKDIPNTLSFKANKIRYEYNANIRMYSNELSTLKIKEGETERSLNFYERRERMFEWIEECQQQVVAELDGLNRIELKLIVSKWAADIYGGDNPSSDSIIYIETEELSINDIFIEVLQDLGLAKRLELPKDDSEVFKSIIGQRRVVNKVLRTQEIDIDKLSKEISVIRGHAHGGLTKGMLTDSDGNVKEGSRRITVTGDKYVTFGDNEFVYLRDKGIKHGEYLVEKVLDLTNKAGDKVYQTGVILVCTPVKS